MEAVEIFLRIMVGNGIQSAAFQFCFNLFGIPGSDAPAEVVPYGTRRRVSTTTTTAASTACAATSASCFSVCRWRRRRCRRSGRCRRNDQAAAYFDAADGSHVQNGQFAVVAADFPAHQRVVVCSFLFEVHDLKREVIQQYGFPSGRLERIREWFGVALRRTFSIPAALALAERGH